MSSRRASFIVLLIAVLGLQCSPASVPPPETDSSTTSSTESAAQTQEAAAQTQESLPPEQGPEPEQPSPSEKPEVPKATRVLFVTQSKGYQHASVTRQQENLAPAEVAMIQLGQQTGLFEVHATQEAESDFTKENLQNYDLVMFYTTGDLPIAEENLNYFFNEWLKQKGHGFIGFHSATDTYHNYEPYWDMIGGTFNEHPWGSKTTVTISVHDPANPLIEPFGSEFQIQDEIYQYKNWQPEKVHVLASLNMAKCEPKKPYHVPVAWCKEYGEGKVFYTNLGHNETTWTDERFLKSVANAVRWIRGEIEVDATPNPDVSAAEQAKAQADAGESAAEAAPAEKPAAPSSDAAASPQPAAAPEAAAAPPAAQPASPPPVEPPTDE